MKVRPLLRWYDLWVGLYVDVEDRSLYVFPVPCVGFVMQLGVPCTRS